MREPTHTQAARNTYPPGLGEPINVVISAESDRVLMFDEGFLDYSQSLHFSGECLGQTGGARQAANLGDGNGMRAFGPSVLTRALSDARESEADPPLLLHTPRHR